MACTELDSTADKAIRVEAQEIEWLFERAVSCMFSTMAEPKWANGVLPAVIVNYEIYDIDIESLLVSFLSEVLNTHEQLGLGPYPFMISVTEIASETGSDTDLILTAHVAFADCWEPHGSQIKAVTYHDLRVEELDSGGFTANLTFDV